MFHISSIFFSSDEVEDSPDPTEAAACSSTSAVKTRIRTPSIKLQDKDFEFDVQKEKKPKTKAKPRAKPKIKTEAVEAEEEIETVGHVDLSEAKVIELPPDAQFEITEKEKSMKGPILQLKRLEDSEWEEVQDDLEITQFVEGRTPKNKRAKSAPSKPKANPKRVSLICS
jgi:hypothetical protein